MVGIRPIGIRAPGARRGGGAAFMRVLALIVAAAVPAIVPGPARAAPRLLVLSRASAFAACDAAIAAAARAAALPPGLLAAVATVESGRRDPRPDIFRPGIFHPGIFHPGIFRAGFAPAAAAPRLRPWPWTINAGGEGRFFASRAEAIAAVRALQAGGVRAIDVGCLQIDLRDHPRAFPSLEQAFDPVANARYAAGFLLRLHARLGSWPAAVAAYHSQSPALGLPYRRLVFARLRASPPPSAVAPIDARYADFEPPRRAYADFAPIR